MGQAVRKLKPPLRPVAPSEAAVPLLKRQSVDIKPTPPEPRIIIEPEQNNVGEWNRPDPDFLSMSQQVVGVITTRPAANKEHPTAVVKDDYSKAMPTDRHTTLLSGPDEDSIQSPGKLNHLHIRELYLLYQGKAEGQEKPLDVDSLAKRFNVDPQILQRVLHYTSLVHFENPVSSTKNSARQIKEDTLQNMKDTVQQLNHPEKGLN